MGKLPRLQWSKGCGAGTKSSRLKLMQRGRDKVGKVMDAFQQKLGIAKLQSDAFGRALTSWVPNPQLSRKPSIRCWSWA